jgi:hypothetical protein
MRETTADLEEMAATQASADYVRPWWKDGEYDEGRAEAANDRGMEAFSAKKWTEAFDEYTEAIRLEPRRAGRVALTPPGVSSDSCATDHTAYHQLLF